MVTETKEKTFGEKFVGISFNPSNRPDVDKAKQLCAELADLINDVNNSAKTSSHIKNGIFNHACNEILNAQMNVVKFLTFED